ncbi:MAG: HAMP domain-containing sensor histidine kinase [Candidatus Hydrothermarchaeales archaeon]
MKLKEDPIGLRRPWITNIITVLLVYVILVVGNQTYKATEEAAFDEFKEAVFRHFERVNKGGVKGTGLGLAISRRIVELHNGKIWVEDNPDGGSIFCINIRKA